MKTIKVESACPMSVETFEYVARQLPSFIDKCNARRLRSTLGYRSLNQSEEENARPRVETAA